MERRKRAGDAAGGSGTLFIHRAVLKLENLALH